MTTWSFYWYKYNITKTVTFYGFEKTDKLHATSTPYYYFIDQVSNHNIHPSYYFHCYLHITTHTCTLDYVTVHRVYTKTSKHSVHLLWKSSAPEISNWKWNWKRNLAFSRWSERKGNHGFFCKLYPSSAKNIANYIKRKKKEVEQVDTSLKRTKRNNMYICLILRECHGIYAYAEAAMACPCNCSLLRLLAVSCIFLYGMGKVIVCFWDIYI